MPIDAVVNDLSMAGLNNFIFVIERLPDIQFRVQNFMLPSLSLPSMMTPIGAFQWKHPSSAIDYEDFQLTFAVDENFKNYFGMARWMFDAWKNQDNIKDFLSETTLIIVNNAKKPIIKVHFHDCWCTNLASIDLTIISSDPPTVYASIAFNTYDVEFLDTDELIDNTRTFNKEDAQGSYANGTPISKSA